MHGTFAWVGGALGERTSGESGEKGVGIGAGGVGAGTLGGDTLGDKYKYEMVAMVKNVDFLVLRARRVT